MNGGLANPGLKEVERVLIGKHILLEPEAANKDAAVAQVEDACKRVLANLVMEDYSYQIPKA